MTQALITATPQGFLRGGDPHLIISGSLLYSRIHPDEWADRINSVKEMGCNTVETYVPWNFHAPTPDTVRFDGWRDLGRFLELIKQADMDAIVRTGPYICGEWEAGGFPGWLLADQSMRLRCFDERYLAQVDRWFDELIPSVAAHQAANGGAVIMLQVENEYGSFGDDKAYLAHLRDGLRSRGITELLITSDGPTRHYLAGGMIEGAVPTVNFGSRAAEVIDMCRRELPGQPLMCTEYWNGWFDHWGEEHHTRDAQSAAAELDTMLANNMSVNFYMGHGGTNFGLWNGSNHEGGDSREGIQPTVTSYDYDAAISEDGTWGEKFHAFREVIGKYRELPPLGPEPRQLIAPAQDLTFTRTGSLQHAELWRNPTATRPHPPAFEDMGLERGQMLLSRHIDIEDEATLLFYGLHDRAYVYVDGEYVGVASRNDEKPSVTLPANRNQALVEILVESQGRVNFGPHLHDRKGVLGGIWLGRRFLNNWNISLFPLDELDPATLFGVSAEETAQLPLLAEVHFQLTEASQAIIDTSEAGRGFVWVNGFMVGRYWNIGPQLTLHVPAPLTRAGDNIVHILELEEPAPKLSLTSTKKL